LHNTCHCEERLGRKKITAQLLRLLKFTSDAAISSHQLTEKRCLKVSQKCPDDDLSARRLLRGFSNAQLSKVQMYIQRKLAMTSVVVGV
jgi:hypothetical protein